jgi:glycosyltransferase involved in cell wall biosynthesis
MAHCLRIFTIDTDGCREAILDGKNGIVVLLRRIEPMAKAIADALKDEAKSY